MSTKTEKRKWELIDACGVGRELLARLRPGCEKAEWAGSVRRHKHQVGDIEILFIPRITKETDLYVDLFEAKPVNHAEKIIEGMLRDGTLTKRPNTKGQVAWGPKNKLAIHAATGLPVDLFTVEPESWWNYLVCRTGPAASNTRIAEAALARGWRWKPYSSGFVQLDDGEETQEVYKVTSEQDVFAFVNLPYQEPHERK